MTLLLLVLFSLVLTDPLLVPFNRTNGLQKRNAVDTTIVNEQYSYTATIIVGNSEPVQVVVDTGSSDLWVGKADLTATNGSSFRDTGIPFYTNYLDGTEAEGTWVYDSVSFGSATLRNVSFGYATFANTTPYLGIGMKGAEAPLVFPEQNGNAPAPYDNIPYQFRNQGIIATATYSLWLNDPSASTGSLLFGGIDTSKFIGNELTLLPMYNFYGTAIPKDFRIILSAVSLDSNLLATLSYSAVLDSGSTAIALPFPVVASIGNAINYTFNEHSGFFFGECANANNFQNIEFNFLGANISVPLQTLVFPTDTQDVGSTQSGSEKQCFLGIAPASSPENVILGDFFLRYVYVTFDLENYELGIAQASHNTSHTNIEEITGRIPGTPAPDYADNVVRKGIRTYDVAPKSRSSAQNLKRCAA